MSIAVSTVVVPSRRLALLLASFCLGVAVILWQLAFSALGNLSLSLRVTLAVAVSLLPVWAACRAIWPGKSLRIDISEHGQIRVAEDKACIGKGWWRRCGPAVQSAQEGQAEQHQDVDGTIVALLPDSTIWPHMLLLRLRASKHETRNVLILRDCLSAEHFRALSVACHWIAAHNDQAER